MKNDLAFDTQRPYSLIRMLFETATGLPDFFRIWDLSEYVDMNKEIIHKDQSPALISLSEVYGTTFYGKKGIKECVKRYVDKNDHFDLWHIQGGFWSETFVNDEDANKQLTFGTNPSKIITKRSFCFDQPCVYILFLGDYDTKYNRYDDHDYPPFSHCLDLALDTNICFVNDDDEELQHLNSSFLYIGATSSFSNRFLKHLEVNRMLLQLIRLMPQLSVSYDIHLGIIPTLVPEFYKSGFTFELESFLIKHLKPVFNKKGVIC